MLAYVSRAPEKPVKITERAGPTRLGRNSKKSCFPFIARAYAPARDKRSALQRAGEVIAEPASPESPSPDRNRRASANGSSSRETSQLSTRGPRTIFFFPRYFRRDCDINRTTKARGAFLLCLSYLPLRRRRRRRLLSHSFFIFAPCTLTLTVTFTFAARQLPLRLSIRVRGRCRRPSENPFFPAFHPVYGVAGERAFTFRGRF